MQEARLFEVFPNAEIGQKKGLFGGFAKLEPRAMPVMRRPPPTRPKLAKKGSIISDADIKTLGDLNRYYPLPKEYAYAGEAGQFVVKRLSDDAQFPILCEEELLTFDVPVQDPKRKKVTVEVFKKK